MKSFEHHIQHRKEVLIAGRFIGALVEQAEILRTHGFTEHSPIERSNVTSELYQWWYKDSRHGVETQRCNPVE